MPVRIEFYGIPRRRAGCESIEVEAASASAALAAAVARLPGLSACCTPDGRLRPGCILNLNGRQFLSETDVPVTARDALLLLSADAGG